MTTPPTNRNLSQEAVDAVAANGGNVSAAARALGLSRGGIRNRLAAAHRDPAISASMQAVGTGLVPQIAWAKVPSKDGQPGYSVLLKPQAMPDDLLDRVRIAFEGMKPAKPVKAPKRVMEDMCTLYPLMDVHLGMLAWGEETLGSNYDTRIAADDMRYAFAKISALTPNSEKAILLLGGDFFHAENDDGQTKKSKHSLDTDGRHHRVLDAGISLVSEITERLLEKHQSVTVRVLRGNHDEDSHKVLTFALDQRYRKEPRVEVDKSPAELFMFHWGKSLISAHHGDKAPGERLALQISDLCPFWSETRHRYCFTGHVHHDKARDIGPMKWESLRAFAPQDSYAAGMGFASRRSLQSLTFCKRDGLVVRATDPIERGADE